jgi:hypothetical protein
VLAQPWAELLGGLKGSLTGLVQLVWLLGRLGVPTACVVLAGSQADVLHGVYLVIMLAYLLVSCIGLQPHSQPVPRWWSHHVSNSNNSGPEPEQTAASSMGGMVSREQALHTDAWREQKQQPHALPAAHLPQHRLLRLYGSCHLLVVYLALVLQLPGLESDLKEYILRLVGLWDPKILSDLVPVLLLLVAATIHVVLGKWLLGRPPAGIASPAAGALGAATVSGQSAGAASVGAAAGNTAGCMQDEGPLGGRMQGGSVLQWLQAVYAKPVFSLLLGGSKLACSAGSALLVLLVSIGSTTNTLYGIGLATAVIALRGLSSGLCPGVCWDVGMWSSSTFVM